jgi:hypothetical protein
MRYSLLIYDGSNPAYVQVAERVATAWADLRPVAWSDERVQSFLAAQFGGRPFSFLLVEAETVFAGEAAVERLVARLGVSDLLAALVRETYAEVADPFGRVFHGQAPADLNGIFALDETAGKHVDPLRRPITIPVDETDQ